MPDTTGLLVSLAISAVIILAAAVGFACLMSSVINNQGAWHSGGSAFTPLQEMIEPKARHVVEVAEQRLKADDNGGPEND